MINPEILIVIPAYNCEKQLPRSINQFIESKFNGESDLIIIDNCSKDKTIEKAIKYLDKNNKKLKSSIKLVRNKKNYGLGGTHKSAFLYALTERYKGVLIFHGDDQGKLTDFEFIINQRLNSETILGSRFEQESKIIGYSNFRIFGNLVFNFIYSVCTRRKITDMGSGINFFSNKLIARKTFLCICQMILLSTMHIY